MIRKVELINKAEKTFARELFNEYQVEWAKYDDSVEFDKQGLPIYLWFNEYWNIKERWPYFLKFDDEVVGLCFIRKIVNDFSIAEFYIKPEYRKDNNALCFANQIANLFIGTITFSTVNKNIRALKFWQKFYNQFPCEKQTWEDENRTHWVVKKDSYTVSTDTPLN